MLVASLKGLPAFAAYLATALAMMAVFGAVYSLITTHREFALIRRGSAAAVPAFLGALLGYVIPLSAAMRWSVSLSEFVLWAVIAGAVQVLAYGAACLLAPGVSRRISADEVPAGVLLGGVSLAFGLLNAASMTP